MKFNTLKIVICYMLFSVSLCSAREIHFPYKEFPTSDPYITGSTVRSYADFKLDPISDFNPNDVKAGDIIFIIVDLLETFFTSYHPNIKEPYIILMHHFFGESDDPLPGKYACYLDDEKLLAWFGINPDIVHPKFHPMPLGIANPNYSPGNKGIFDKCINKYRNCEKNDLLYVNFSTWTNPEYREPVLAYFKEKDFVKYAQFKNNDIENYLIDVSKCKFVLSPRGHGLDCFRTWEALLMGSFPIVGTSPLDPLFEQLPVVVVNDWKEVTSEFLDAKYQELSSSEKHYNFEKLYMPYWLDQMNSIKNEARINFIHGP